MIVAKEKGMRVAYLEGPEIIAKEKGMRVAYWEGT